MTRDWEIIAGLRVGRVKGILWPFALDRGYHAPGARATTLQSDRAIAAEPRLDGHETHTVYDGQAAVEAAAALHPDVILLDIGLPKLNGYEAARQIRERHGKNGIVLVALTGWGQEEDRRLSREAGFDAHLVKPVEHAALVKLLASLPLRKS